MPKCYSFYVGANLKLKDIKSCGISTQRATFINWRKSNGEPLHNFVTWKDLRAVPLVNEWNSSLTMKVRFRIQTKLHTTFTDFSYSRASKSDLKHCI